MKELKELREEINQIDKEILDLYQKRLDLMFAVSNYKAEHDLPVEDKTREEEVIKSHLKQIKKEYQQYYESFMRFIMTQGKELQSSYINKNV